MKDIPYHNDSHETLDRVHVQHVLSKGAFMLPPLSKIKVNFIYSGYKCNCWLKIVKHWDKRSEDKNVTMVLCEQAGKEIKFGLKLVKTETDVADAYMQASFKTKKNP